MGAYETGLRTVWRSIAQVFDGAAANAGPLGRALPDAGAGRNPVLLIGGYANDSRAVSAIARSLERDGFETSLLTLPEHGMGDLEAYGPVIRARVAQLRVETGHDAIDVIGYSSGGIAARAAAQLDGGDPGIGRIVTLATANAGLDFGRLNWFVDRVAPQGIRQIREGSDLIRRLHDTRHLADVVSVGTNGHDGLVPHASNFTIAGAPFLAVDEGRRIGPFSRVTHASITRDHLAYETVRGALLAQR